MSTFQKFRNGRIVSELLGRFLSRPQFWINVMDWLNLDAFGDYMFRLLMFMISLYLELAELRIGSMRPFNACPERR